MAVLQFVVVAAAAYVLMRAAWIFLGWPGVVVVAVLVATLAVTRRRDWPVAAGSVAGAAVSAYALTV